MFMNNTVFERISQLFSHLGIDVSAGSTGAGEARAYAAGFDLVNSAFDSVFKNIYIQTAEDTGLRTFLSYEEFETQFRQIAPDAEIVFAGNLIAIRGFVNPVSPENLIRAGKFLKKYAPVFSMIYLAGGGLSYESFDNLEMRWFELDEVNMPFHMLDGLE